MSKRYVFALVCDVCNKPMMYWVEDTGMARCDNCLYESGEAERVAERKACQHTVTWSDELRRPVCSKCGMPMAIYD